MSKHNEICAYCEVHVLQIRVKMVIKVKMPKRVHMADQGVRLFMMTGITRASDVGKCFCQTQNIIRYSHIERSEAWAISVESSDMDQSE